MPKVIACLIAWRAERFLRAVLDAACAATDEVWVALGARPRSADPGAVLPRPDRTEAYLSRYPVHLLRGDWPTEHAQRNALLDAICATPQPPDTFVAIIDTDEVYDPAQLAAAREHLAGYDVVQVPQRVYFKHGNWLVTPVDAHGPADVFLRLEGLRFIDCRCANIAVPPGRLQVLPRSLIEVHHMNTVGTWEEIEIKYRYHGHAGSIPASWFETWKAATLSSRNLHQTMPQLLPGLRRVPLRELPAHLLAYSAEANLFDLPTFTGAPASAADIGAIRQIRNAGRAQMTERQDEITAEEQRAWWAEVSTRPPGDFLLRVYREEVGGPILGYGMLSLRNGVRYVSLGVHPDHQGQGLGTFIYRDLRRFEGPVFAKVRADNLPSLRAAERAGYVKKGVRGETVLLMAEVAP